MKNNSKIIECYNNTHQGVPHPSKQMCVCASDLGDGSSSSSGSGSGSGSSSRMYRLTWHKLNTIAPRTWFTNYREKN